MQKRRILLIIAAAAVAFAAADANAQRTFVERPGASIGLRQGGDWRAANSLNDLNRELREVQLLASRRGGARVRFRLAGVARVTDMLNYEPHELREQDLSPALGALIFDSGLYEAARRGSVATQPVLT